MTESALHTLRRLLDNPDFGETRLPDGTSIILDMAGHQVVSLCATSVYIVEQIRDGVNDLDALAKRIASHYDVDEGTARDDAGAFVDELSSTLSSAATRPDI